MRREQILKICLNHVLTTDIDYQPKDDKSWHFVAHDFSEGEVELLQFCLRFKNADIATAFKEAVDGALAGTLSEAVVPEVISGAAGDSAEATVSDADKRLAESLQLPVAYFALKTPSCTGCRGCQTPEFQFAEVKHINVDVEDDNPLPLTHPVSRSRRTTPPAGPVRTDRDNSPSFGFPAAKLGDGKLFGSITPFKVATTSTGNIFGNADKPSVFGSAQKSIFSGTGSASENGAKPLPTQSFSFGSPSAESPFKLSADATKADTFSFKSTALFGQPATLGADSTNDQTPKSVFGGGAASSFMPNAFSNQQPISIFGGASTPPAASAPDQQTKTLFGGATTLTAISSTDQQPKSIFGGTTTFAALANSDQQSKSIFGGATTLTAHSTTDQQPKTLFGGSTTIKPIGI